MHSDLPGSAFGAHRLYCEEFWFNCCRYTGSYFILKRKNVRKLAVIPLRPNVIARDRIDKLTGDAHTLPAPAHAPFEYLANAEIASHLLHVSSWAPCK